MDVITNQRLYDKMWSFSKLFEPQHWGHWKIIQSLDPKKCLEIGPGNHPKIPIKGNYFVDVSKTCLNKLQKAGGIVYKSNLQTRLPFKNGMFDLICCFEVLEHVPNDLFLLRDISRLLKPSGVALISFPINMKLWNEYDRSVGHYRRYEVKNIEKCFHSGSLEILEFTCLKVAWPGKLMGNFLSFIISSFYPAASIIQDLMDSLPFSELTREIKLKPWRGSLSEKYAGQYSTILLKVTPYQGRGLN